MCAYVCACLYVSCVSVYVCACVCACVYTCVYVSCVCVYVCACVYVCDQPLNETMVGGGSSDPKRGACMGVRVWVHGCMGMHPYTHTPMHPCTLAPMHPYTHAPMHSYTHAPMHPCTHAPIHPYTHAPMHPCTHAPMHPCTHTPMHLPTPILPCAKVSVLGNGINMLASTFQCGWDCI